MLQGQSSQGGRNRCDQALASTGGDTSLPPPGRRSATRTARTSSLHLHHAADVLPILGGTPPLSCPLPPAMRHTCDALPPWGCLSTHVSSSNKHLYVLTCAPRIGENLGSAGLKCKWEIIAQAESNELRITAGQPLLTGSKKDGRKVALALLAAGALPATCDIWQRQQTLSSRPRH